MRRKGERGEKVKKCWEGRMGEKGRRVGKEGWRGGRKVWEERVGKVGERAGKKG